MLLWLNILAATGSSVKDLLSQHWSQYGRNFYTRHDYEAVETETANAVMDRVRAKLSQLVGQSFPAGTVTMADEFAYDDPVDGSRSENQGLRVEFDTGARIVFRLPGTGTEGATIRVYLEAFEDDPSKLQANPAVALASVIETAEAISRLKSMTGRSGPDVTT